MKNTLTLLLMVGFVYAVAAQTNKSTLVRKQVSLKSGEREIVAVTLENTHSRSYTDSSSTCDLTNKAEGVIWRIVYEGKNIDFKAVTVANEQGRLFQQTCWSKQGSVYTLDAAGNRTGGGPQTEILAVGPDDSKKVTITFGDAKAEIEMLK